MTPDSDNMAVILLVIRKGLVGAAKAWWSQYFIHNYWFVIYILLILSLWIIKKNWYSFLKASWIRFFFQILRKQMRSILSGPNLARYSVMITSITNGLISM